MKLIPKISSFLREFLEERDVRQSVPQHARMLTGLIPSWRSVYERCFAMEQIREAFTEPGEGSPARSSPVAERIASPSRDESSDLDKPFGQPLEELEGGISPPVGERLIPRGTVLSSSADDIVIRPAGQENALGSAASCRPRVFHRGAATRAPIKRLAPLTQSVPGSRTFNDLIRAASPSSNVLINLERADYNTSEWVFRNTVSFWVGVFFVEGSILFIVGSAAAAFHPHAEWRQQALIGYPYFAGSITYTAGTYLGYYEVPPPPASCRFATPLTFGCCVSALTPSQPPSPALHLHPQQASGALRHDGRCDREVPDRQEHR